MAARLKGRTWPSGSQAGKSRSEDQALSEEPGLAADSKMVAGWTLVSRITGFGRVAAMAAVLGPTYFGNLFQTLNYLPNIICELLSGSLITAMLVPVLVRFVDSGDRDALRRLASGFLGTMYLAFTIVAIAVVVAAPFVVSLITAAVPDPTIRAEQERLGWLLLGTLIPQIFFYGLVATSIAIQHAHRRFALPSAAPALENLGIIAVMGGSALLFGVGNELGDITTAQMLWLGIGCTGSVALHAAVQWWGACRAGVALVPRAGWSDPEVRRLIRMAVPSSGYAVLNGLVMLGLFIVAGRLPGGAVALQVGLNFFNLPIALCARPLAAAQLPRLSRSHQKGEAAALHATYRSSLALTAFLVLPTSFLFMGISETLARVVSFGEMGTTFGITMVATSIAGLGLGILGESMVIVGTSASYARRRPWGPLQAQIVRAAFAFAGMALAWSLTSGIQILWTLALSLSVANLAAGAYLHTYQVRDLPSVQGYGSSQLLVDLGIALLAVLPAIIVCQWLTAPASGIIQGVFVGGTAVAASSALYLGLQWVRGSNELASLRLRPRREATGETVSS